MAAGRFLDESVKDYVIIHRPRIRGKRHLVAVKVNRRMGRSMAPLVRPGAVMVLDRKGGATLKRLFYGDGSLMLIPENQEEQPQVLRLMKGETAEQFIVGQVIWIS